MHIDADLEGNGDLLPFEDDHGRIRLQIVEIVGQCVVHLCSLRLHIHAQGVFRLVIGERAPGS